jgi:hypothetical protein
VYGRPGTATQYGRWDGRSILVFWPAGSPPECLGWFRKYDRAKHAVGRELCAWKHHDHHSLLSSTGTPQSLCLRLSDERRSEQQEKEEEVPSLSLYVWLRFPEFTQTAWYILRQISTTPRKYIMGRTCRQQTAASRERMEGPHVDLRFTDGNFLDLGSTKCSLVRGGSYDAR